MIENYLRNPVYRQTNRQTDRQTNRQTDRQTNRQTDRQTDQQTDRQTNIRSEEITLPPCRGNTRNSSGDEIPECDVALLLLLLRFTPRQRNSPGTISVKFSMEVKGWLRYTVVKKYCAKFHP